MAAILLFLALGAYNFMRAGYLAALSTMALDYAQDHGLAQQEGRRSLQTLGFAVLSCLAAYICWRVRA